MTPREQFIVSNAIGRNHRIVRTRPRSDVSDDDLAERRYLGLARPMEDCPIEWTGFVPGVDGSPIYLACQHHEPHERPANTVMESHTWLEKTPDSETRTIVYVGQCPKCLTIFYAIREVQTS
jgi:hypothetical protein